MGGAWANNWGNCDWDDGNVNINNNNNFNKNYNKNVNKGTGAGQANGWQHNPQHRGNAPYANKQTANETPAVRLAVLAVPVGQVALAVPEDPAVRAVLAVLEDQVVRVALVAPENPAVRGVLVELEDQVARVVLAALENQVVRVALAALPRRVAAAPLGQAGAPAKAAETRSVAISRRQAVVVAALSLAAVGALLKLPAIEVAVV